MMRMKKMFNTSVNVIFKKNKIAKWNFAIIFYIMSPNSPLADFCGET